MSRYKRLCVIAVMLSLTAMCACAGNGQGENPAPPSASSAQNEMSVTSPTPPQQSHPAEPDTSVAVSGEVVTTFDYERQSGSASNQFAVWIEDMNGSYINTLYATRWTANGGYRTRPDSIALWVEKSDLAAMPKSDVDAISGATPRTGSQSYTWDLTDTNGDTVEAGEYKFFVEGTLRWKNYVLYSGAIEIGDNPATVQADAEFVYEASDRYAALSDNSPENKMIGPVTASFVPAD